MTRAFAFACKSLPLAFLLVWVAFTATGQATSARHPNIVIVLSDTHRHDYTRYRSQSQEEIAPNAQRLRESGVELINAYAPAPISAPAYATLLSGLDPLEHGLLNNEQKMGTRFEVLPEQLRAAGYETAAVLSNPYTSARYGFDRGFDYFWDKVQGGGKEGGRVTDAALSWLKTRSDERPFFLFLAYMDAHTPFISPELMPSLLVRVNGVPTTLLRAGNVHVPNRVAVTLAPGANRITLNYVDDLAVALPADAQSPMNVFRLGFADSRIQHEFERGAENTDSFLRRLDNESVIRAINPTAKPISTRLEFFGRRLYPGPEYEKYYTSGIRSVDRELGRVMGHLDEAGLLEDSVFVFVADHGEMLGEHGEYGHVHSLYEPAIHIPLLVRSPLLEPGTQRSGVFGLAGLRDLVFELAGLSTPSPGSASGDGSDETVVFATYPPEAPRLLVGVVRGSLKLIHDPEKQSNRLFEVTSDPAETEDLYPSRRDDPVVVEMLRRATNHAGRAVASNTLDLDSLSPEVLEDLKVLGYIE